MKKLLLATALISSVLTGVSNAKAAEDKKEAMVRPQAFGMAIFNGSSNQIGGGLGIDIGGQWNNYQFFWNVGYFLVSAGEYATSGIISTFNHGYEIEVAKGLYVTPSLGHSMGGEKHFNARFALNYQFDNLTQIGALVQGAVGYDNNKYKALVLGINGKFMF